MYGLHILCFRRIGFFLYATTIWSFFLWSFTVFLLLTLLLAGLFGHWKIIAKLNIFRQKCKIFLRISEKQRDQQTIVFVATVFVHVRAVFLSPFHS